MSNGPTREQVRAIQRAYPKVWHACHRHPQAVRKDGGLTDRESRVLVHLADGRLRDPKALGSHLGMAPSTLSEAIDELVQKGLVERRKRESDRRKVDYVVTESGNTQLEASSPLDGELLLHVLKGLEEEEREAAVRGLELLANACISFQQGGSDA